MSCRSLWLAHLPWAARWHWLKQHRRSCQQDRASHRLGGCVRTSCRGRSGGKRHSSKVIKLLFYCPSCFLLSVQTAQCELALPQDSVFHAKYISQCFEKRKCSSQALNRERETGRQTRSFWRRFEKWMKEQQSRKMHGEPSDCEKTQKSLQSIF